jgi:hypothetical protein
MAGVTAKMAKGAWLDEDFEVSITVEHIEILADKIL